VTQGIQVLVTGAGGFIGANLTRRLVEEGHAVTAVERPGTRSRRLHGVDAARVALDLRDRDAVLDLIGTLRPAWVFHLAAFGAYSWQTDREGIFATDVRGTVNLLDACIASDCEVFVNTGSSSEYGYVDHAPTEDEAPRPTSLYGTAKAAATLFTGLAGRESERRYVTLRPYSVYGPWEDERRLVPTLITKGLSGELPPLVSPQVAHDYVYVDDVVDAYLRVPAAEGIEAGDVFNVGTGTQTTMQEIVELARRVLDIDIEPLWGSMPDRNWDTNVWVAAPHKAAAILGWRPRYDLETGFAATVDWMASR
jgi:nucleoside-diphosphate-sugar epimerase